MKGSFWLMSAIFSCFCASCVNDTVKTKATLTGFWSVETAFRDKRETSLLADVFFQFGADGKMITNLPNTSDELTDFEIKGDQLFQKTSPPIAYKIQQISDSMIILMLEMNNTPFEIHLKKSSPTVPAPVDSLSQPVDSLR